MKPIIRGLRILTHDELAGVRRVDACPPGMIRRCPRCLGVFSRFWRYQGQLLCFDCFADLADIRRY